MRASIFDDGVLVYHLDVAPAFKRRNGTANLFMMFARAYSRRAPAPLRVGFLLKVIL
jgi:hypothetical protein